MKRNTNRFILVCSVLALSTAVSWMLFFQEAVARDTVDIHSFPKKIGSWTSVDLPLTKDEYAILETKNAFVRRYTNSIDHAQIYLYLVYSQTNRKVAHPPEICYTGSGMTILEDVHEAIPVTYKNMVISANRLRMSKGRDRQIAYYWFKVGNHFTSNYWKQQALIALYALTGRSASSALVRISADITEGHARKTMAAIKHFTDLITPKLFVYLP